MAKQVDDLANAADGTDTAACETDRERAQIACLRRLVDASKSVVFFGGAGVSTESGIPDFRSRDGLYRQAYRYLPETILSAAFFAENPMEFYRFYYEKIIGYRAQPNAAHKALAALEKSGKLTAIVTQNIDDLHERAGNRKLFQLHGSVTRNRCLACGKHYDLPYVLAAAPLPHCACGGLIKPDVVLYGELLDQSVLSGAIAAIEASDLLIVGGTSLTVYPAAGLVDYAGGKICVVNRDPTSADSRADLVINGLPIGKVLDQLCVC